jgi:hypothetical protein
VAEVGLLERLRGQSTWPPRSEAAVWEQVELYSALRENDEPTMRMWAQALQMGGDYRRAYVPVPLAKRLANTNAALLFGEPVEIKTANDSDQELMDDLAKANKLDSALLRAARISGSEGEVWGKVSVAPALLDAPIIEFVSRKRVIPKFVGKHVAEATFVTTYDGEQSILGRDAKVWRLLETHTPGAITMRLFHGSGTTLGAQHDLSERDETAPYAEIADRLEEKDVVFLTGFDVPLCVFIPNELGEDMTRGLSLYDGLVHLFFSVNNGVTIGHQNMRATGKQRLLAERRFLDRFGNLPDGDDVFYMDEQVGGTGENAPAIKTAQYDFHSEEQIRWIESEIDWALTMAGIAPQSMGRSVDGSSVSGTALRLRMAHTIVDAGTRARLFDDELSLLLSFAAQLDARPMPQGFNRGWSDPVTPPSLTHPDPIPSDPVEDAQVIQVLDSAGAISLEEKVRRANPGWDEKALEEEVERIANSSMPEQDTAPTSPIPTTPPAVTLDGTTGGATLNG